MANFCASFGPAVRQFCSRYWQVGGLSLKEAPKRVRGLHFFPARNTTIFLWQKVEEQSYQLGAPGQRSHMAYLARRTAYMAVPVFE